MTKTALIDFSKGWEGIKDIADSLITCIRGEMTYFPLCCSTGILKNVTASKFDKHYRPAYIDGVYTADLPDLKKITETTNLWELIRLVNDNPYFIFPWEVGAWYCMSLCRDKKETGRDEHGKGAYSGYKAAQITMFDRLLEDKSNTKYRFANAYNMVFSVDHFQQWLSEQNGQYGEVYVSPAVPGGHQARVRGCIYTPDLDAAKAFEKERLEILKAHITANYNYLKSIQTKKAEKTPPELNW